MTHLRNRGVGLGHQQPLATSSLLSKAEPKTWVWEKKGLVSRRAGTELPLPHKWSVVMDYISFVHSLMHK